ncbi:MAG: VanZ family protein [Zoogloeaceae bacterium]|jgi:VanZ family protein|nr:VanZ family protein [Zoogloeaceae bacterium]
MTDPAPQSKPHDKPDRLPRYLALAWVILTVYGSLYPFTGWQTEGIDPFAFLQLAWPRYWTTFDLIANVVIYLPTGFLFTLALRRLPGRLIAPVLAILLASLLSLTMESLQTWLPSRFASVTDLGCNTLGALFGALFACFIGGRLRPYWKHWRPRLMSQASYVDMGLTLLGLWLLTLLSPETLPLGVGDLRQTFSALPTLSYSLDTYRFMEKIAVASNFLAVGLFFAAMTRGRWLAYLLTPLFFLLAALSSGLGAATLVGADAFFAWLTPSVREGATLATPILVVALLLPGTGRLILAALCLLVGTILVNLTPINPYSEVALALWRQGHFLNFNGLTRWISTVWPFCALPYLVFAARKGQALASA